MGADSQRDEDCLIRVPSPDPSTSLHQASTGTLQDNALVCETDVPIRFDLLSSIVYVFGVPGSLLLLLFEHRSDFVRFHAWQAFLIAFAWLVMQATLRSVVGMRVGWLTGVGMLGSGWIGWRVYRASAQMRIFELPWVGPLAMEFVRSEY